jgi:hypothetical protein
MEACIQEVAEILYRNTSTKELTNFERVEQAVRTKILEEVSPKVAFFYQTNYRNRKRKRKSSKEYGGEDNYHRSASKKIGTKTIYSIKPTVGKKLSTTRWE